MTQQFKPENRAYKPRSALQQRIKLLHDTVDSYSTDLHPADRVEYFDSIAMYAGKKATEQRETNVKHGMPEHPDDKAKRALDAIEPKKK